jgi:hypothetical protein
MKLRLFAILAVALLVIGAPAAAFAAPATGAEWHRLNPDPNNVADEHERLRCVVTASTEVCRYDKVPEPGFAFNTTTATFRGKDVTAGYECPDWFADACAEIVSVHAGRTTFVSPGGHPFTVAVDQIVVVLDGQTILIQYWVDQFACPWYGTFEEALDANPSGDFDCFVAP